MLIKINHDTYINSESVEAVQKTLDYIEHYGSEEGTTIENVIIYTNGGGKFYYDGTLEQCIEQLVTGGRQ